MSEEGGFGDCSWEFQSRDFSNSGNSGGSEEKCEDRRPDSSTKNPTGTVTATAGQKSRKKRVPGNGKGSSEWSECGDESDHEMHIWTERKRRKKMRTMFSSLHALLPQLPAKADKSTIIDEAVNYIKTLEQSLQKLQEQRQEIIHGSATMDYDPSITAPPSLAFHSREAFLADQVASQNLAIAMSSQYSLQVPHFPACFQTWSSPNVVLNICDKDAQISVCSPRKPGLLATAFYVLEKHKLEVISAHIFSDYYRSMCMIHAHASRISDHQFPDALPVEEIYKSAVGEMIFWFSSS